jgi:hypothetical protein
MKPHSVHRRADSHDLHAGRCPSEHTWVAAGGSAMMSLFQAELLDGVALLVGQVVVARVLDWKGIRAPGADHQVSGAPVHD